MKYKQFSNDKKTIELLEQERLDEINWSSIADKAKSIVKNKKVAGDAKTREGGRKAAKLFMKYWKKAGEEATAENLLKWIRKFEHKNQPDDEVIKYAAQYHKYEAAEEENETKDKDDKLTFKPLIPSEKKILAKLLKRKIKKYPSRWRNFKKLEKELTYLDNDQKLALARAGRIKFKEITGR